MRRKTKSAATAFAFSTIERAISSTMSDRDDATSSSSMPTSPASAPPNVHGGSGRGNAPDDVDGESGTNLERRRSMLPLSTTNSNNRRNLMERGWSTSNLSADGNLIRGVGGAAPPSRVPRQGVEQHASLFESWTTPTNATSAGPLFVAAEAMPIAADAGASSSLAAGAAALLDLGGDIGPDRPTTLCRRTSTTATQHSLANSSLGDVTTASSRNTESSGNENGALYMAARIGDWEKVLHLCATDPTLASYVGADGWTALHHVCNRRCPRPQVAEALIVAFDDALVHVEEKNWTPLHYACRFKAPPEVVRLLLTLRPERGRVACLLRDTHGRTPLWYAVRYDAPPGVMQLLLQVAPAAILEEDKSLGNNSTLALVWDDWANGLTGRRVLHAYIPPGFVPSGEQAAELRAKIRKDGKLWPKWQMVNMLLKCAFGFALTAEDDDEFDDAPSDQEQQQQQQSRRCWRIVHATAAIKCHLTLFHMACALHPEQIRELDQNDLRRPGDVVREGAFQTVLHLAASSKADGEHGRAVMDFLLREYASGASQADGMDGSLPLHRIVANECKTWALHVAPLHAACPDAVGTADTQGRLPLHAAAAAIKQQHTDDEDDPDAVTAASVILQLVRLHPEACARADNDGFMPFHYLAMHAEIWDNVEVEGLYQAHPAALRRRAGPQRRLPLHMACSNSDAQLRLVERMVALHPLGAASVDQHAKLPLHLACESGKDVCIINCLHEAHAASVQTADDRGWLPLHIAAYVASASIALLERLIELYPQAAALADPLHRYPLHLACRSGRNWQGGLQVLFAANQSAVSLADKSGVTPFFVSALQYCGRNHDGAETLVSPVYRPQRHMIRSPSQHHHVQSPRNATASVIMPDNSDGGQPDVQVDELDIMFNLLRADPLVLTTTGAAASVVPEP